MNPSEDENFYHGLIPCDCKVTNIKDRVTDNTNWIHPSLNAAFRSLSIRFFRYIGRSIASKENPERTNRATKYQPI